MTSEHPWGQWLKPYLNRDLNKHHLHRRVVKEAGPDVTGVKIRAGGPLTSSVAVVCGPCNTQWLSGIQNRARPHLAALLEGKGASLNADAQAAIATWAAMAAMTGEHTLKTLASIAIGPAEYRELRDTLRPPAGWRIWVGTYRRAQWSGHYVHASMPIMFRGDLVIPNPQERDVPLTNTQWTIVIIGEVYIHTASSSSSPDYIRDWNWLNARRARRLLVQIWPTKENFIAWPMHSLTDADAQHFSVAHFTHIHDLHQRQRRR
jgi:hypothetical protein